MNQHLTLLTTLIVMSLVAGASSFASAQLIVAHRGASGVAPENTLAAFEKAWELGADAIEADFRLTRDNRIVCIHDDTTKRTGGKKLVVADSTLEELRKLEYGRWKSDIFDGEKIPTIEEVLVTVPEGKLIYVEIKSGKEIVPELKKALLASKLKPQQIRIISFNRDVVAACKNVMPNIKAYWLVGFKRNKETKKWYPKIDEILQVLRQIKADGLDCKGNEEVMTSDFVAAVRQAGYELHTWTINSASHAKKMHALGVDSITTNYPDRIRKAIKPETMENADRQSTAPESTTAE